MQQVKKIGTEEPVASELSNLKYYLATQIYKEFQEPLMQILFAADLLAENNHKLTMLEQLQHIQLIRDSVKQMIEVFDDFLKDDVL